MHDSLIQEKLNLFQGCVCVKSIDLYQCTHFRSMDRTIIDIFISFALVRIYYMFVSLRKMTLYHRLMKQRK